MKKTIKRKKKLILPRVFTLVFMAMFAVSLIMSIKVLAANTDLKIVGATVTEKSANVTANITGVSNNEVKGNVLFHKLYDSVTYKLDIKNNLDKEITIITIDDNNSNPYIEYRYDKHEGEKLGAGKKLAFYTKAIYSKELTDITKRNQPTKVKFTIKYSEDGNKREDDIIINPKTNDNLHMSLVMLLISSIGLVACLTLDKNRKNKKVAKILTVVMAGVILTPIIAKAVTYAYEFEIVAKYGLYDKEVVTYVVDDEENTLIAEYGQPVTGLVTPTKEGYTFTKWTYEDGSDFDPATPITKDIKIIANFAVDGYTITYDLNGGTTATENPTIYKPTDRIELVNPTKEHYTFIGWTGTDLTEPTMTVIIENQTGNRSYVANYIPVNYTITYEGLTTEEKSALNNPSEYNIETTPFDLNNPANRRDSDDDVTEIFVGWREGTTTSETITLPNLNSMGNKTFEAVWVEADPTIYTITYELHDGTTTVDNPTSFTKKTDTFTLVNPTKEGYEFKGWSGTDLIGDENKVVSVVKGTRKNLSFEAHYTANNYQVKFEKNGTNVSGTMANQNMTYDQGANLTAVGYTREGYTFNGWNTSATGSGTHYDDQEEIINLTSTKDEVVSLYAEWVANTYTITFNGNPPVGSTVTGDMEDVDMTYDIPKTLPLNLYSVVGYSFDSWNTKADGSGTSIANGAEVDNLATTGTVTLYATWAPRTDTPYKVIHKQMNLDGETYTEVVKDRQELTGTTNASVTPATKTYTGFTAPSPQTVTIAPDGSTEVVYLYSRNKYDLTIEDPQYVVEDKSGEYFYESEVSLTAKDREDYKFTGWSNGETTKTITLTIEEDTTIKPLYEINIYMITLDPNEGSVSPTQIKVTKGEAVGTLPTPTRDGYDFDGWYTNKQWTTKVTPATVPTGDDTYYAKWEEHEEVTPLCKKATALHTTTCPSTAGCKNAGYSEEGSKGTTTVTFGTIPHVDYVAGNAFDCDMNGDGVYDPETERFYYLITNSNDNAVLISHTNYEGEAGQVITDNFSYSVALTKLPTTAANQWSNAKVTFKNPIDSSDTNTYAARFVTYDELREITGKNNLTGQGSFDDYPYLMENSQFVGVGRSGIWMAPETTTDATTYYRIHTGVSNRNVNSVNGSSSNNVARPVIEVPLEYMESTKGTVHTITFETNGGTEIDPLEIEEGEPIGEFPTTTRNGYEFAGWFYEPEFVTEAQTTDTFDKDTKLYAKWNFTAVAKINDTYYSSLESAITDVPDTGEETVIKLLTNTSANATIAATKYIVLDLQNYNLSNSTKSPVLTNNGYLVIKNGTISTDSAAAGAVDNGSDGTMEIRDATIISTGDKQALYNNGGTAEIFGDSYLSNSGNLRAAVHNLNDGTIIINSGTIISTAHNAVYNEAGTLTIGEHDGVIDTTNPVIQGYKSGLSIATGQTFNFYDGIIKGKNSAIDIPSALDGKEAGSEIKNDTEVISGVTYQTAIMFMESSKYKITFDADGGTVSPEYITINIGDPVGTLPTPSKGVYTFDGWFTEKEGGEEVDSTYTPEGSMTIYAKYHYEGSDDIVNFNMTNDAMKTYYSSLGAWLSDTDNFQANMDTNFNNYNCSECTGPNYQACPTPAAGKTLCDQSVGYATGVSTINVYKSDETTKEKGPLVTYTTVKNGTIYNMIPGETYYWEDTEDSDVHGYVKVSGNRRTIASNVRNVRDLGGLEVDPNNDGVVDGTIKYGKLFRGAKLSSSASDVAELQKLGITEEVDLRGSSGDAKFNNYKGRSITNYLINYDTYHANYLVFRQALTDTMQEVIDGENIYFHCAIGTDRTGTMAYFLEGLLGASEEDRVEDYELSYFTGLLNRHRFHDYLSGSSINPRFTTMHNSYKTSQEIYQYFMAGSTDIISDQQLIQNFRDTVIDYN